MYSVAFNKVSLVVSIFVMGVMLHPIIAVSAALSAKRLHKIAPCFYINKMNSMIVYLGFIVLNQMYLYITWEYFREEKITENCKNTTLSPIDCANSFKTANSYRSLLYNQCDCKKLSRSGEDSCVNPDNDRRNILEDDVLSMIPQDTKYIHSVLIGCIFLSIILHILQNLMQCLRLPLSVPMHEFILFNRVIGPSLKFSLSMKK